MVSVKRIKSIIKDADVSEIMRYYDKCLNTLSGKKYDTVSMYMSGEVSMEEAAGICGVSFSVVSDGVDKLRWLLQYCIEDGDMLLTLPYDVIKVLDKNGYGCYNKLKALLETCNGVLPKFDGIGDCKAAYVYDLFGLTTLSDFSPCYIKRFNYYLSKSYKAVTKDKAVVIRSHDDLSIRVRYLHRVGKSFEIEKVGVDDG